jgi:uncharacterized protein
VRAPQAFFLQLGQDSRFCILHEPSDGTARCGAVLYVHPFAEEMNKSRRVASLQCRDFAVAGWTALQLDLYGCGDSPGDFSEARWHEWVSDIAAAHAWLRATTGHPPLLWGIRAGCLLAIQAAAKMNRAPDILCWEPVVSGKTYLQQFLRIKAVSELMQQAGRPAGTQESRDALARGETVEIAGYPLTPDLAAGLECAELELPAKRSRIAWFEIRGSVRRELAPQSRRCVEAFEAAGHQVTTHMVQAPAFWDIADAGDCPGLIHATVAQAQAWL